MRNLRLFFVILLAISLTFCQKKKPSIEDLKYKFGLYGSSTLGLLEIDYTKTPINKKIERHPENYTYLDSVDMYSIGYKSGGWFVMGMLVCPKAEGKYPVILYNRGGNRDLGSLVVGNAVEIMAPLAAQGYVVAATNYRGTSLGDGNDEFGGKDVNDVINLINSLSEFGKADTSRVGLLGISRGGMMNYLAARQKPEIRAIATIGGITDLDTTIKYHPEIGTVCKELIPDFDSNRVEAIKSRSAVYWVNEFSDSLNVLILHSKTDQHVNFSQVPPFVDSLKKYNINHKLVTYEDDTHGLTNHQEEVREIISDWFGRHLKK